MTSQDPPPSDSQPEPVPPPDDKDEKLWATLCHLSGFALYVLPSFGNIIGPLIVWLIKKDQYPLVDDQGKEVLNFQISMTIYVVLCLPLVFLLIGIPLLAGLLIFQIVVMIIGAVKASTGEAYRYPLCIRFLK